MSIPFFYEPGCDANINVKLPRALLPEDTRDGRHPDWPADLPHYPFAAFLLNKLPIYTGRCPEEHFKYFRCNFIP